MQNPYVYSSRERDKESGLYFYRARYLDPRLGRFLTPDPIGFRGGINLYRYVGNNPINFVDPLGLHRLIDPRTGQPVYHRHGNNPPHLDGDENCKGTVTRELPPDGGTEAFNEAMKEIMKIYGEIASMAAGLAVSSDTGNPQLGYETYDALSNIFKTISGAPASPPGVPIDIINPPGAE